MEKTLLIIAVILLHAANLFEAKNMPFTCPTEAYEVTSTETYLLLPGYEQTFPAECTFQFHTAQNHIQISFETFQFGENCDNYILVGTGNGADKSASLKFCGKVLPKLPVSSGEDMFMTIIAPNPPDGSDISFQYKQVAKPEPITCDGPATQIILGQPTTWPPVSKSVPQSCTVQYEGRTDPSKRIKLENIKLWFPKEEGCAKNYVQISNGNGHDGSAQKYCGDQIPKTLISRWNNVTITIKVTKLPWGSNLQFTASEVDASEVEFQCTPKTYNASETQQVITIPPDGLNLPITFNCTYDIRTSPHHAIDLKFTRFKIGTSTKCDQSYVMIYEGNRPESERTKLCGEEIPTISINKTAHIYVHVEGTSFDADDGFALSYTSVDSSEVEFQCTPTTYTASERTQEIIIPPDGLTWPPKFNCTYDIISSSHHPLELKFTRFKVGTSTKCDQSYVMIYEGNRPESEITKLCGEEIPKISINKATHVSVHVEGTGFDANDGFALSYTSGKGLVSFCKTTLSMLPWFIHVLFHW